MSNGPSPGDFYKFPNKLKIHWLKCENTVDLRNSCRKFPEFPGNFQGFPENFRGFPGIPRKFREFPEIPGTSSSCDDHSSNTTAPNVLKIKMLRKDYLKTCFLAS